MVGLPWRDRVEISIQEKSRKGASGREVTTAKRPDLRIPGLCYTDYVKILAARPAMEATRFMINLTPVAATKVKEIMGMQNPAPTALRVAVVGGGCSGFQYHMAFENQTNETDEVVDFDGLKVAVDQMSSMYLDGVEIDYVETLEGAGFKFNNPNVKSTCGCGSSFSV